LALDMKLEDRQLSLITATVDAMSEHQSIQQSAGVLWVLNAHQE